MNKQLLKKYMLVILASGLSGLSVSVHAANWLMLQGTEPADTAARAKVWGFIQAQYQKDESDPNPSDGTYIPLKLVGPDFKSQEAFGVNRARLGVRGTGMPIDSKVNYFLLAEFGHNGITAANDGAGKMTDASITLNHIKGARVRVGLFKTPMAEEIYQGIALFDYINFTIGTNHLLNERFANADLKSAPLNPQNPKQTGIAPDGFERGVGAGRDVGVQLFDAFQMGAWEHSYSVMYGNGNGLNYTDNDENKDLYLYISSEKVFDGSGPRRNGMKFFIWSIDGKRTVDDDGTTGVISNKEFDRKRAGAGFKLVSQSLHMTVEYITAEGMIWLGPHKDNFDMNALGGAGDGRVGKADARYIEAGYRLPGMKWELDLRYDEYHRLTNGPANLQVNYTTTTLGAQYHFNKKSRFTFNYEDRAAETASANASLYGHLSTLGPRISAQITHIF